MSRLWNRVLIIGGLSAVSAGTALAFGPADPAKIIGTQNQSLIVRTHGSAIGPGSTERQKCKALNRCRYKYTRCYDKLVRDHKDIEKSKVECVKPYQKCINASFSGFDFFFTRWFNPEADCSKF